LSVIMIGGVAGGASCARHILMQNGFKADWEWLQAQNVS